MSFILDALKKSEDRRRLEEAGRKPTHTTLDLGRPGARRWPSWLFVAVLAVALAGGWWLRGASLPPAAEKQAAVPAVTAAPKALAAPPTTCSRLAIGVAAVIALAVLKVSPPA
jgi:hypothetical protein